MEKPENPSENPNFSFSPNPIRKRRRPLMGKSVSSFIRILSECHHHLHPPDSGGSGVGQVSTDQCDQLEGRNDSGSEIAIGREKTLGSENEELGSRRHLGFSNGLMEVDGLNCNDFIHGSNKVEGRNQKNDDVNMEEFVFEELFGEKAPGIDEMLETIDSFIDTNVIGGSLKDIMNKEENTCPMEMIENELQQKERELRELLSATCVMDSSPRPKTAGEIEEGEISKGVGLYEKSMDALHGDIVPAKSKSLIKVKASKDKIHKNELSKSVVKVKASKDKIQKNELSESVVKVRDSEGNRNKNELSKSVTNIKTAEDNFRKNELSGNKPHRKLEKEKQSHPLSMNTVSSVDNVVGIEPRKKNLAEIRPSPVFYGDIIEDKTTDVKNNRREIGKNKIPGTRPTDASIPASHPKSLALSGESSGGIASNNQCSASNEKDAGIENKKRKRGPATPARKAKKKKKERMKRAEKNRELGVKRLKLQPVVKQKPVTYCRHYLQGRCQEGEKCKFSHDTIPLTKSKPCCHFARQSCMKGDDCPFDHNLFKYPCNTYMSQGSCNRGADCLFSHQLPVKETSPIASDIGKPEMKAASALGNLNLKNPMNRCDSSLQNTNAKLYSSGILACRIKEKNVPEITPKPSGLAPKGVTFLSHGKLSSGSASKPELAASTPKADNAVKVSHQIINGVQNVSQNLNENTKKTPAVTPRGINFLSFGKAPSEVSSGKKSSTFSFLSNLEILKSSPSDFSKIEQAGSSSRRDNGDKVNPQTGQGASNTSLTAPWGVNCFSVGKAQSERSVNIEPPGVDFKQDYIVSPSVQERSTMANKFQMRNSVQPHLAFSSQPGQCTGQRVDVKSTSTRSSSQVPFLLNTPTSVQKALHSKVAFAAKFQSDVKKDSSYGSPTSSTNFNKEASSAQNGSMKSASAIMDFLYGTNRKTNA